MSGSRIRLYGSTSGYVELEAPAVSPDASLVLPSTFAGVGSNVVTGTRTSGNFTTSSTSYVDVTDFAATITLTSASSKVLVMYSARNLIQNVSGNQSFLGVEIGGNIIQESQIRTGDASNEYYPIAGHVLHTPGSVGPHTYQMQLKTTSGGTTILQSGTDFPNSITLIEVAA